MPVTRSRFSVRQAGSRVAVDVKALSPQARRYEMTLTSSGVMVVQNASRYMQAVVNSTAGVKVVGAYVTFAVVPAQSGGTATLSVRRCAVDGSTFTDIVTAATVLTGYTAFIPVVSTLAAANPSAITVGQSIVVTVTASNNAVGTNDSGCTVTLLLEPIEDTVISDTDDVSANGRN